VVIKEAYLGGFVFGGGKEVGAVGGELEVVDLMVKLMRLYVLQLLTGLKQTLAFGVLAKLKICQSHLCIVLANASIFVASNNVLAQITPPGDCGLALCAGDPEARLLGLVREVAIVVDIENGDRTQETHPLFCNGEDFASIRTELDPLDSRREFPHLDTLSSLHIP
jgi:hypothetical protein